MNKELINILKELSNKKTTELALSYMEIYADYLELKNKYQKSLEVAQDRFDRIQKAIEYISKHNCIATYEEYKPTEYEYCCSADLLNILKGDKNE